MRLNQERKETEKGKARTDPGLSKAFGFGNQVAKRGVRRATAPGASYHCRPPGGAQGWRNGGKPGSLPTLRELPSSPPHPQQPIRNFADGAALPKGTAVEDA